MYVFTPTQRVRVFSMRESCSVVSWNICSFHIGESHPHRQRQGKQFDNTQDNLFTPTHAPVGILARKKRVRDW